MFPGFDERRVPGEGVGLRARVGGAGPPLLLMHGHPQTSAMWHRVAPELARDFTVVAIDLRGYGASDKPAGGGDHAAYSKRAMALDAVGAMRTLGFGRFRVLAHDRGARVAHRLALDHPERVERMVLLDVAPTLAMYERTSMAFATAYFHWFFHIQPEPLPERLIGADPRFYLRALMGGRHAGLAPFAPEAMDEYLRAIDDPATVRAICEDYRASATIDLDHDRADRDADRRVACPLLVLWGRHGTIERCFEPLAEWRRVAGDVGGQALDCGHYVAEEAPADLLAAALPFLRAAPG
ncbi:MAG: alpha/beta hydrolase [Burkholderiaceae bacterium]|nr:alpha/beta fold hydrolase [Burkholderiales bacterium]MCZ8105547.1 alpha/beta hydrolase [Burkholderiales bacterium]MCZ8337490.1 alpha/beta hydrolase [Burkholderiaceae bacterium]